MQRGNAALHKYNIKDELSKRVLDLIDNASFTYPIDCVANSRRSVYQYTSNQENPTPGAILHHATNLVYPFNNVLLPTLMQGSHAQMATSPTPSNIPTVEEMSANMHSIRRGPRAGWLSVVTTHHLGTESGHEYCENNFRPFSATGL